MGVRKTTKAMAPKYFWKTMRKDIESSVQACDPCQRNEAGTHSPLRHLKPLDPSIQRWASVSMDFITPLPLTSRGNNGIYVVVDCFHEHVYRNHGLSVDVVCCRDPIFF